MELNPIVSIPDALKQAMDQKLPVEIFLRGGQSFKGPLRGVSDHSAVIGPLQGQEFFDVQVRLEEIAALSLQTRGK